MVKTTPVPAILGTGRRKTSVARVRLIPGSGVIMVNDKKIKDYLTVPNQLDHALGPLRATDTEKKYDISILAEGGGMNGQAGAIRLGIARALLIAMAETKPVLRAKGMLTRDSRMKERKKYGQPGARKRFQFSKR